MPTPLENFDFFIYTKLMRRLFSLLLSLAFLGSLFFSCVTKQASSDEREKANLYFNLGNAYVELGQYTKAVEAFSSAYSLDREFSAAGYHLVRVYIHEKKYDEAESLLLAMLAKEKSNTLLLETAGFLYHHKGNYDEALRYYNRVIAIDEVNLNALFNTYLIYRHQKNEAVALKQLQKYIDLNKNDSPSIFELAAFYEKQGDKEKAIENFKLYLEKEKEDKEKILSVKKNLVQLYLEKELYSEANLLLESLQNEKEPDPTLLFDRAWTLLIGLEEYKKGIEVLGKAIEAGFSDKKRATQMATIKKALYHDEIVEFLKSKNLYDLESLKSEEEKELSTQSAVEKSDKK